MAKKKKVIYRDGERGTLGGDRKDKVLGFFFWTKISSDNDSLKKVISISSFK